MLAAAATGTGVVAPHLGLISPEGDHPLRQQPLSLQHLSGAPSVETVSRRLQPLVVEPVQILLAGGLVAAFLAEQAEVGHQPAPRRVEDLLQLRGVDTGGKRLPEGGQLPLDVDAGIGGRFRGGPRLFRRICLLDRGRANPR